MKKKKTFPKNIGNLWSQQFLFLLNLIYHNPIPQIELWEIFTWERTVYPWAPLGCIFNQLVYLTLTTPFMNWHYSQFPHPTYAHHWIEHKKKCIHKLLKSEVIRSTKARNILWGYFFSFFLPTLIKNEEYSTVQTPMISIRLGGPHIVGLHLNSDKISLERNSLNKSELFQAVSSWSNTGTLTYSGWNHEVTVSTQTAMCVVGFLAHLCLFKKIYSTDVCFLYRGDERCYRNGTDVVVIIMKPLIRSTG